MNNLWVEIETLVLDGVPLDAVQGRRVAQLTEVALAHLLDQRGVATRIAAQERQRKKEPPNARPVDMKAPAPGNERKWAEELALILYRAIDRSL
jgi:hypothetical protein